MLSNENNVDDRCCSTYLFNEGSFLCHYSNLDFLFHGHDYNAKLSDFGLAKDGPVGDKSHVSTRIMGTYGYAAPEYIMTGLFIPHFIYIFFSVLLQHRDLSFAQFTYEWVDSGCVL